MKKGFFFSLDTALAVIVATVLIIGTFFNLSKGQEDVFGRLYISKIANDVLITLNKNKTLDTLDSALIKNRLNDILPDNLAFKLNITVYECDSSTCQKFNVVSGKNVLINPDSQEIDSITAKRSFLTFENNQIKYFSVAELRVWLR